MTAPNGRVKAALDYLNANLARFQDQLVTLSRIAGVSSAEPAPAPDDAPLGGGDGRAAMRDAGVEHVELLEIPGVHPYVYGDWLKKPGAPTILLYGHHDVQPEGRPEKWLSPPYEPVVRDGRLFGRGTADDKAGCMTHIAAVASYLKSGGELPVNVRFVIEGEEEIGSENLDRFLKAYRERLDADFIVLSDTANFDTGIPALTYQLRGICTVDLEVQCLERPVHSGMWGGPVPDPVQVACQIIAGLSGKDGKLERARSLRPGREDRQDPARAHPQAALQRGEVQARGRPDEGHEAHGREGLLGLRAALDAPLADGDRLRGARDQGLLEPDHRQRARAAVAAHGAQHGRAGRPARRSSRSSPAGRRTAPR